MFSSDPSVDEKEQLDYSSGLSGLSGASGLSSISSVSGLSGRIIPAMKKNNENSTRLEFTADEAFSEGRNSTTVSNAGFTISAENKKEDTNRKRNENEAVMLTVHDFFPQETTPPCHDSSSRFNETDQWGRGRFGYGGVGMDDNVLTLFGSGQKKVPDWRSFFNEDMTLEEKEKWDKSKEEEKNKFYNMAQRENMMVNKCNRDNPLYEKQGDGNNNNKLDSTSNDEMNINCSTQKMNLNICNKMSNINSDKNTVSVDHEINSNNSNTPTTDNGNKINSINSYDDSENKEHRKKKKQAHRMIQPRNLISPFSNDLEMLLGYKMAQNRRPLLFKENSTSTTFSELSKMAVKTDSQNTETFDMGTSGETQISRNSTPEKQKLQDIFNKTHTSKELKTYFNKTDSMEILKQMLNSSSVDKLNVGVTQQGKNKKETNKKNTLSEAHAHDISEMYRQLSADNYMKKGNRKRKTETEVMHYVPEPQEKVTSEIQKMRKLVAGEVESKSNGIEDESVEIEKKNKTRKEIVKEGTYADMMNKTLTCNDEMYFSTTANESCILENESRQKSYNEKTNTKWGQNKQGKEHKWKMEQQQHMEQKTHIKEMKQKQRRVRVERKKHAQTEKDRQEPEQKEHAEQERQELKQKRQKKERKRQKKESKEQKEQRESKEQKESKELKEQRESKEQNEQRKSKEQKEQKEQNEQKNSWEPRMDNNETNACHTCQKQIKTVKIPTTHNIEEMINKYGEDDVATQLTFYNGKMRIYAYLNFSQEQMAVLDELNAFKLEKVCSWKKRKIEKLKKFLEKDNSKKLSIKEAGNKQENWADRKKESKTDEMVSRNRDKYENKKFAESCLCNIASSIFSTARKY